MNNKIINQLSDSDKQEVYNALREGKKVYCTNNKRLTPHSYITLDGYYKIGIEPKDISYFDFELQLIENTISTDDIEMVVEFTNKKGIEKGKKAFEQTFKNVNLQYSFEDILAFGTENKQNDEQIEINNNDIVTTVNAENSNKSNNYIGMYEEGNYRIIGKLKEYTSVITKEAYTIITNVRIINTELKKVEYSADGLHMAINREGYISLSNYVEMILCYWSNEKCDLFWKNKAMNKFFLKSNSTDLEIYYKNYNKQQQEQKYWDDLKQTREQIEQIKKDIQVNYNNNEIAVIYDLFDIYIIDNKQVIDYQNNNKDIKHITKLIKENNPLIMSHIINHKELTFSDSDLPILKELLKISLRLNIKINGEN